jgi:hypothetical protein
MVHIFQPAIMLRQPAPGWGFNRFFNRFSGHAGFILL